MGGSLTEEELGDVISKAPGLTVFVETGTYHGSSTSVAAKLFDRVFTIEINRALYEKSFDRFVKEGTLGKKVFPLLGDSVLLLPQIMDAIKGPALFFIDAHQSGSDTSNNGICVPLYEELKAIIAKAEPGSVYIIDDVRLFSAAWDWEGITPSKILEKIGKVKDSYVKDDRFYVFT